jgi:hypothetical protein
MSTISETGCIFLTFLWISSNVLLSILSEMKLMRDTVSKSTMQVTLTSFLSMMEDSGSWMRLMVDMFSGCSLRETEESMDSLLARVALLAGVLEVSLSL